MKYKRIFILGIATLVLLSIAVVVYAKISFNKFNYDEYISNSSYSFIGSINNPSSDIEGMNYESMFKLDNFFIDEKVKAIEDLVDLSKYVLIIKNIEPATYIGNGIINNCTILKVIKGDNFKVNDKIKIYDLAFHWDKIRTIYLGGNTPLKKGDEYIVFLRDLERPSVSDTYTFSSVKYGRVSIFNEREIMKDYEQGSLKVKDILNYDLVFSGNNLEEIDTYLKIVKDIREYANK